MANSALIEEARGLSERIAIGDYYEHDAEEADELIKECGRMIRKLAQRLKEKQMPVNTSPVVEPTVMTFTEAVTAILSGKRVRRQSWTDEDAIFLHAGVLHLRNAKGLHTLLVSEGDMTATDWIEVIEH
jgi:hypothetical protein